ncbi:putative mitochondrial protein [Dendrobium catenatum]|uniref:Putative mitochondrial protein n=1 Tax=Dendrobium catenatum TaxID=906689 RepID=A0A2I0WS55_9ASPA|nr:putative mitochondrial protein [Dendrobium catenatum]
MTHSVVPNGVLHFIERLGRRFLWQKDSNSRGMHYVGWKELCKPRIQGGLGFHDLIIWKSALRARIVWDLLHHPESVLYKVLMVKYEMKLWDTSLGKKSSATWKIIQDGASALRPILRWNIGNGMSIDVFQDVWIMDRVLDKWTTFVNVEEVENFYVGDLLNNSSQWNEELIKRCFGAIMAERILAIDVGNDSHGDCPELIHDRRDMTVAAMAYRINFGVEENNICWLYNLKLHPRERFFW